MKRALAERAKQSGRPNGVAPASPAPEKPMTSAPTHSSAPSSNSTPKVKASSSSTSLSQLPPKTMQIAKNESSSSAPSARPSSASPRPKKRLRESVVKLEDEDEDDSNASAFYLRHQNRALASELRSFKNELSRLSREREYRRSQCSKAVQSLNALQATWTQMEAALQYGQQPPPPAAGQNEANLASPSTSFAAAVAAAPLSTGSGTSVELIGALLDSLAALGTTMPGKRRRRIKQEGDEDEDMDGTSSSGENEEEDHAPSAEMLMDGADTQQLDDLLRITDNVAKRATTLQRWIWSLLQRLEGTDASLAAAEAGQLNQEQVARFKAKNKTLKAQLKELARSRDEMTASDKRVRRGLYRLAAGRVQLKEVLKAIVISDEDKEAAAAWLEVTPTPVAAIASSGASATPASAVKSEGDEKEGLVNSAKVAQMKKQISDVEQLASARDEQIKKLLAEREDQSKRINNLVLKADNKPTDVPTDDEVKRSDLYAKITTKLAASERNLQETGEREKRFKEEWSQALANAESAQQAMEEMQSKHLKRWAELAEENPGAVSENGQAPAKTNAGEIITLQHKLTQALENVRQAETTRKTLEEAVTMNGSLQAKLEEIKAKYTALQHGRASSSSNNHTSSTSAGGITTPKPKSSSSSGTSAAPSAEKSEKPERSEKSEKSSEKLHRDYRRVRKDLAAATASKEAAKAKLERTEKERDSLNQTNSRLLMQAAEKDEMNAKSLSTILHLKQLSDQITKEKENLEQQVKSAQQLALAARLAANARVRVAEEFEKERKSMEAKVKEWEKKCEDLTEEKEGIESKLSQQKAKMSGLLKGTDVAKGRCYELVAESTKLQEEKHKMMESLAIAQKDAAEAAQLSNRLSQQSGGGAIASGFTAEQLSTQVAVLKNRLICPVCNARDKKCILLRCRHMFCKPCVDENLKNRSRKCPACACRFDTKDVADVWL